MDTDPSSPKKIVKKSLSQCLAEFRRKLEEANVSGDHELTQEVVDQIGYLELRAGESRIDVEVEVPLTYEEAYLLKRYGVLPSGCGPAPSGFMTGYLMATGV